MPQDPRRRIPRTDALLADSRFVTAADRLGMPRVKSAVQLAQSFARQGAIRPEDVAARALEELERPATSLRPIINATGVVVHTNIGRAPLSAAAVAAIADAAGYVDVEFDRATGKRARRGRGALEALLDAVPAAGAALVVNNGAAALLLAALTLAGGKEVLVSRGELIEIGDGFRLPALLESAGVRLREVGTTNRTHLADFADAIGADVGAILKVHTSNYRVDGFACTPSVSELAGLGFPLIADVGSGLLAPDATIPDEPDAGTWLAQGATVVTASGDKLLGGPQAGIVLGRADAVEQMRRHPIARALRVDKLTLAALEATLRSGDAPVASYLHHTPTSLRQRTESLAAAIDLADASVVEVDGRVGGGGAPGVALPGLAVALPESYADRLRLGDPCVLARVSGGRCLVDLRCIPAELDEQVANAIRAVRNAGGD